MVDPQHRDEAKRRRVRKAQECEMIQAGANIPSTLKSTETLRSAKWESSSIFGKPYLPSSRRFCC